MTTDTNSAAPLAAPPLDVDVAHGEGEPTAWGHSFALARELRAVLLRGDD